MRPTRKKNGNREFHTDPGAPSALHRFQAHRLRRLPPVWFAYHDFGGPVLPAPLSWVSKRHVGSNCLVGSSDSYVRKKSQQSWPEFREEHMRSVHPCKRPIPETVNSKFAEQLIGRGPLFEPLHPSL